MPALHLPPMATTVPPLISIRPLRPLYPPPMPAPYSSPVATTMPPSIVTAPPGAFAPVS